MSPLTLTLQNNCPEELGRSVTEPFASATVDVVPKTFAFATAVPTNLYSVAVEEPSFRVPLNEPPKVLLPKLLVKVVLMVAED